MTPEYHVTLLEGNAATNIGEDMIFEILDGEFAGIIFAFKNIKSEDGKVSLDYNLLYDNGLSSEHEKKRFESVIFDIFTDMIDEIEEWNEEDRDQEVVEEEDMVDLVANESLIKEDYEDEDYEYTYDYLDVSSEEWDEH